MSRFNNIIELSSETDTAVEWMSKKSLLKRWEGLNIYTLNKWLTEMRRNKKFRKHVINPTHKTVFINLEGFKEFLLWKQRN